MTHTPLQGFPTLADLERVAAERVPDRVWAYIQTGAGEERSLEANRAAFRRWSLRPRVLSDVTSVDLRSRILGREVDAPLFVAPMAYQREVHPEGEEGVARAAEDARVLSIFSTLSSASLEEIARAAPSGPRWFQLYLQPEFARSRELVERAERSGYSALVLTVDVPVLGVRDRQEAGGFAIDASVPTGNGPGVVPPARAPSFRGPTYELPANAAANWGILDDLRSISRLPVILKGILSLEDARRAARHSMEGIVVSNHGGRQLDGAAASLDALPAIAEEVGSTLEVYVDGGVRRASDVLIALALGAKAVGLGRPILWALAVGGGEGVREYLSSLSRDLATAMALTGRRQIAEIDRTLVQRIP
jgi:4-hydroxymandelate oxidase